VDLDRNPWCATILLGSRDLSSKAARSGDDLFDNLARLRDLRLRVQGLLAQLVRPTFRNRGAEKRATRLGPLPR
jgi:hypothetical protein